MVWRVKCLNRSLCTRLRVRFGFPGLDKNAGKTRVRGIDQCEKRLSLTLRFEGSSRQRIVFCNPLRERGFRHFYHSRSFLCRFLFKKKADPLIQFIDKHAQPKTILLSFAGPKERSKEKCLWLWKKRRNQSSFKWRRKTVPKYQGHQTLKSVSRFPPNIEARTLVLFRRFFQGHAPNTDKQNIDAYYRLIKAIFNISPFPTRRQQKLHHPARTRRGGKLLRA